MKQGTLMESTFTLLATTLGSGIITLPYLSAVNGIVFAALLIIFGAIVTYFSAMLLVEWAEKIGKYKYEDFAEYCWGSKMAKFAGLWNVVTLLGFVVSYIVFIKTLVPHILIVMFGEDNIPELLGSEQWKGQIVWATIYTLLIMIPLSIPRKVGTLEYVSSFGFLWATYLTLCLIFLFFTDRSLVPNIGESIQKAEYFTVSITGISSSIPFVIFSFMYQPTVPIIYNELNNKTTSGMRKVLILGSIVVVILYILASTFGYLGVVAQSSMLDTLLSSSNVLEVDYKNWAFNVAVLGLLFTVISAVPMCILPAKDDFETVFFHSVKMTKCKNLIVTLSFSLLCWGLAISIPNISDIISILGCTTNPMSGFIFPILFYLKMYSGEPNKTWKIRTELILCWITLVFIIIVSILSFALFILGKLQIM